MALKWCGRILLVVIPVLALAFWAGRPEAPAQAQAVLPAQADAKKVQRDLEDLQVTINRAQVTIYFQNNTNTVRGQIMSYAEYFGKRFLVLNQPNGMRLLVNFDSIAAIQQ